MSLKDRLLKLSKENSSVLENREQTEFVNTGVPILNIALSGDIDGGLSSGSMTIASPPSHFKTMLGLLLVSKYLEKYDDAVCLFYDSENGAGNAYFDKFGIDKSRVLRTAITSAEGFRTDISRHVYDIKKGEKAIIFVDSLGNIPSKKEIEDSINAKDTADMTRAKVMKSIMRIIGLQVAEIGIPAIFIGHVYDTLDLYSKKVLSGGTGVYYNSETILFIGKRQSKKGTELQGFDFTLNIEKSRYVREGLRFPFKVFFEEGIRKYSGLLDLALDGEYVVKPKVGWYSRPCVENDKNFRESEIEVSDEFWTPILEETDFKEYVKKRVSLNA